MRRRNQETENGEAINPVVGHLTWFIECLSFADSFGTHSSHFLFLNPDLGTGECNYLYRTFHVNFVPCFAPIHTGLKNTQFCNLCFRKDCLLLLFCGFPGGIRDGFYLSSSLTLS